MEELNGEQLSHWTTLELSRLMYHEMREAWPSEAEM